MALARARRSESGLNYWPGFVDALSTLVLFVGIILAFQQVIRLYPEIGWVNSFRIADPGLVVDRRPRLLAPMAAILGDRVGRMSITQATMRHLLDSIATRLDEALENIGQELFYIRTRRCDSAGDGDVVEECRLCFWNELDLRNANASDCTAGPSDA